MSDAICAELLINVLDNSVSAVVTLVLNEPLSVCKFVMLVSSVVSRVDNDELKLVVEPEISDAICAEDETNVLDNSVSAVVILVEKLPLSVCKLSTFVSSVVILELNEPLSVCKFVILVSSVVSLVDKLLLKSLDEPELSDAICAELDIKVFDNSVSAVVILVEKLPLSVCKFMISVSFVVTLVLNEPLSVCKFVMLVSSVVNLVDKLLLKSLDEPEISDAICALLLIKVFPNSLSAVVIRVEKLALGAVNEPDISEDICAELDIKVFPNSLSAVVILVEKLPLSVCKFMISVSFVVTLVLNEPLSVCKFVMLVSSVVNLVDKLLLKSLDEPLMSDAICTELLIKVLDNSVSAVLIRVEKLLLAFVKEPDISDEI